MEDIIYWERLEVLDNDSYDYEDEVGSQPGSFDYDDPRDYEEWCDWNDTSDPPVSIGVVDSRPELPGPEFRANLTVLDFASEIDPGPGESFRRVCST